ncbi:1047_t:CDS:2, partial [Paraglomus occultum]
MPRNNSEKHKQNGPTLPDSIREELEVNGVDNRKFEKKFKNRAKNRKEKRKLQRLEKKRKGVPVLINSDGTQT